MNVSQSSKRHTRRYKMARSRVEGTKREWICSESGRMTLSRPISEVPRGTLGECNFGQFSLFDSLRA